MRSFMNGVRKCEGSRVRKYHLRQQPARDDTGRLLSRSGVSDLDRERAGVRGPGSLARSLLGGVPLPEPLHAARGVHQLLFARVVRMAVAADFDADVALGGTRLERIAAGAV